MEDFSSLEMFRVYSSLYAAHSFDRKRFFNPKLSSFFGQNLLGVKEKGQECGMWNTDVHVYTEEERLLVQIHMWRLAEKRGR
jgi:hypothetical protein